MRESRQSPQKESLVCLKKAMLFIAFRILLTLDVKILWFGRQMTVCANKWHENYVFGCSKF